MKKIQLTILLSVLMSMVGTRVLAYDIAVANDDEVIIYYDYINNGTELMVTCNNFGEKYAGTVNIPKEVTYNSTTYSVTSLGDEAFYDCSGLTSVTIPNSVTSIGDKAFYDCSGLTSVTIPNSITSIGNSAFSGCSSLTSVTIPNSVTSIGNFAFSGCSGLTSVSIGNSVTSIGTAAFSKCSSLTSITIPNSVTTIGDEAFYNCSGLTSVTIPNSVTSIGSGAFAGCSGLTSITVESGNTVYDSRNNCNAIIETASNVLIAGCQNTIIPNSVTIIADYAFYDCSGLTSIIIPNSVTSIGNSAFYDCSGLTSIIIPNSVTSIGNSAFSGCSGLTSVTIPNSVTSIGSSAFSNCSGLTSVELHCAEVGSWFRGITSIEQIVLGDEVTTIGKSAFRSCSSITSITIPNSVTSIGKYAFDGCSNLQKVIVSDLAAWCGISFEDNPLSYAHHLYSDENTEIIDLIIPNSVTSIGNSAFSGCSSLTSVTIPNSVTSIGENAFYNCSGLQKVIVPDFDIVAWCSITFGDNPLNHAHHLYSDENTEITNLVIPDEVTSISDGAFSGCTDLTTVTINSNSIVAANRTWNSSLKRVFGNQVKNYVIGDAVTSIGRYAFYECSGLTSITIGSGVTSIGNSAFSGCSSLTSIAINSGNTVYDSRNDCNAIIETASNTLILGCQNTIIPNSVTSIGSDAFRDCSGLTSITIPNSVTSIGSSAFRNCSGLTSITFPNSVTSVGTRAFDGTAWYDNLPDGLVYTGKVVYKYKGTMPANTSIILEEGTSGILGGAFDGCSGLTSVTIPNSVTDIGNNAFNGCSNLTTVTINSNNIVAVNRDWDNSLGSVFGNQVKNYILGDEVTSIGNSAFSNCSGLTSVTIGNSVTSIGECAFEDCSGLTSIFIPNSVTSIGFAAFSSCDALQKVIVPDLAAWCGISFENESANPLYYAHHLYSDENTEITDLVIPNSVTSISGYAFSGCSGLTSVTIPNNVTNIGYSAFENCSGLTSVEFHCATIGSWFKCLTSIEQIVIGDEVTSIGSSAFSGCSGLTSITVESGNTVYDSRNDCNAIIETASNTLISGCKNTLIPDGVTSIGIGAFAGCTNLSSIIIPSSVTSIASNAFQDCTNLSSITTPNNITSVGYYAFGGTAWYDNLPDGMVYIGKVAYNYKGAMPANTNIILEEGTLSITVAAFRNCIGLTSITIPNSITNIGNYAFQGCSGLTSVTIPNSVTSIGVATFQNCSGLTSVTISNSVTSIGETAFKNCSGLTSLDIPSTVTSIGNSAFSDCTGLTEINCYIESPYGIDNSVFSSSTYNSAMLRVPVGTKSIYKIANGWYNFQNIEEFVESTDVSLLTDAIYANDMKASKGNYGTLIINLKNEQATNAYSFDLKLPTGVTLAMEGGDYVYTLSGRHNGHSATISYQSATDVYSIAALSLQSKTLNGNDGTIITLKLNIATDIALDSYPIRIQNAKYSLVTGETKVSMPETTAVLTVSDFVMGDVNNDGDVDIADAVCIVNHVVGKDTPVFVVAAADVNHDGDVDIADAVCIVNLVVGKISALSREEEWSLPEPQ